MFDYNHYVPILKGKQGEFKALKNLPEKIRDNLTPMIDIPPIDEKDKEKKSLDVHLTKKGKELKKAWGLHRPVFVDIFQIDLSERIPTNNEHPLSFLFNSLRQEKINAIPVTGF